MVASSFVTGEWRLTRITLVVIVLGVFVDCTYQNMLAPMLPDMLYDMQHAGPSLLEILNLRGHVSIMVRQKVNETKKYDLQQESSKIGILISAKALTQIFVSPIIGSAAMKLGYGRMLVAGFFIMATSCLLFAVGLSYWLLLLSKLLHGLSSTCIRVSGFGMLANSYTGDERETMLGLILSGVICGEMAGLIYGSSAYQLLGKLNAFLIIGLISLVGGILHLITIQPDLQYKHGERERSSTMKSLLKDPLILCIAGCIFFGNIQFSMLQACLPLRMMNIMNATEWETGIVLVPQSIVYFFGVISVPVLLQRTGRWIVLILGLLIVAFSFSMIAIAKVFIDLLLPIGVSGLATAMIDLATLAELGNVADTRHSSAHAKIYAISEFSTWLGFAVGPVISGVAINQIGFPRLMFISAFLCVLYVFVIFIVKSSARENRPSVYTVR